MGNTQTLFLDCFYFDVYAIMLIKWKIKMEVENYGNHPKL